MVQYNTMMVERYRVVSDKPIPAGNHAIEVKSRLEKPGAPAIITILLDGVESARLDVNRTVPLAFTASETSDIGVNLGSPVSIQCFDQRPFAFTGELESVEVALK